MTTSGTVAQTAFDTATVIETAFRRCRVHPSRQTPEKIQIAQNCLYLLLSASGNLGLNLWAIEKQIVGCEIGQTVYPCPTGTIDLLNLIYSTPTREEGTDSDTATSFTTELADSTTIVRFGVKLSAVTASDTLVLESSADGATWTTSYTKTKTDWTANTWYWFDLDPQVTDTYFRVSFTNAITVTEFYLASRIYDLPVMQWNRDTWTLINNKGQRSHPSTNYYYEKLLTPQVTIWPVPDVDYQHLSMFIHRQVQDVGTLIQTLEIPQRWFEAIVWQLASRLCFELEEVDPAHIPLVVQMSEKYTLEAGYDESDGATLFMTPQIRGYTR